MILLSGPNDEKAPEKTNGTSNVGDHAKPDSSFYDKLPFHGLKTPPKKVKYLYKGSFYDKLPFHGLKTPPKKVKYLYKGCYYNKLPFHGLKTPPKKVKYL